MSAAEVEDGKGESVKVNPVAAMLDQIDARKASAAARVAEVQKRNDDNRAAQLARAAEDSANIRQALILRHGRPPTDAEMTAAEHLLDLEAIQYGSRIKAGHSNVETSTTGAKTAKSKGGRPTAADREELLKAFRDKVRTDGLPERTNPVGWQSQADVGRWIEEKARMEGVVMKRGTRDDYARKFMRQARLETQERS